VGGKSTPDYGAVAAAQGAENEGIVRDQLYANRPDQYTPWGYSSWQQEESVDANGNPITNWSQTQGLTPELQDILNKQIAIQGGKTDVAGMLTGRLGGEYGQAMDWRGLNPMGQVPTAQYTLPEGDVGDPNAFRQRGEDAMYNSAMSRLQPQQASARAGLETKMRNQGLRPGDAAWKSQMSGMDQSQTDQNNQAMWSATDAGRQEAAQMWGQGMGQNQNNFQQALGANAQNFGQSQQNSQYANQIRQQQMTEAMQQRGFGLNEINALLSGQQVGMPGMPNFNQAQAAAPADLIGASSAQAGANAAADPMNGLLSAAGTLGAGAMMMSDRRMKTNIKRIGTNKGYPWYSYNLKTDGSAHEGVMADEIPQQHVIDMGGISLVNYGTLLGE
jgi:hypothetical protein